MLASGEEASAVAACGSASLSGEEVVDGAMSLAGDERVRDGDSAKPPRGPTSGMVLVTVLREAGATSGLGVVMRPGGTQSSAVLRTTAAAAPMVAALTTEAGAGGSASTLCTRSAGEDGHSSAAGAGAAGDDAAGEGAAGDGAAGEGAAGEGSAANVTNGTAAAAALLSGADGLEMRSLFMAAEFIPRLCAAAALSCGPSTLLMSASWR